MSHAYQILASTLIAACVFGACRSQARAPEGGDESAEPASGAAIDPAVLTGIARAERLLAGTASQPEQQEAVGLLGELCERVPAAGCTPYGDLFRRGRGVDPNRETALQWFGVACDAGDGQGCVEIGSMYRMGQAVERSDEVALRYYQEGCEKGAARGCNNAAVILRDGAGVTRDPVAATALFVEACEGGYWVGCEGYARAVFSDSDAPGAEVVQVALAGLEAGCAAGEVGCCMVLAERLVSDEGSGSADLPRARGLFSTACNANDLSACVAVARMMHVGQGGPADPSAARQLFDVSCRGAVFEGCFELGLIYGNGLGVAPDPPRAANYLDAACRAGHQRACVARQGIELE